MFGTLRMLLLKVITATKCSDAVGNTYPVINMCESGSVTNKNIILDTFNSASHEMDSCTCDIKIHTSSDVITVDKYNDLVPNIPKCGSEVVINIEKTFKETKSHMTCFVSEETFEVADGYGISISWHLGSSTSDSQYCLKVSAKDSSVTISCGSRLTTTKPYSTTASLTFTGFSMTEPASIATSRSYSATPVIASDGITSTTATTTSDRTSTMTTSTSDDVTTTYSATESASTSIVEIVAPVAGGAVAVIIIVIFVAVIYARKKQLNTESTQLHKKRNITNGENASITNPFAFRNHAVSRDNQCNIIQVQQYASVDDAAMIDYSVTNSNNVYTNEQKKPKAKRDIYHKQNYEELMTYNSQGHFYASLNKPALNKAINDNGEPSRYKIQDELVYVEVDVQSCDPSFPPIPPPKRFLYPSGEQNHVLYSEVETESRIIHKNGAIDAAS